ncbi:hypothetical protein BGZ58_006297 [Dissophora ornata]|nr:hypothetical protein BGZ58_006297 [Dissophora ornata]
MDPQQIEALAQQLARQFVSMRPQQSGNHSATTSHAGTLPSTNQNTAETAPDSRSGDSMAELATQLGDLLSGRVGEPAQGTVSTLRVVDPYASVPDPSIYEKEFTDTFLRVNASVLRFEDTQLLDLACEQMPIDRFYEEAEAMSNEYSDDSTDDIVVR